MFAIPAECLFVFCGQKGVAEGFFTFLSQLLLFGLLSFGDVAVAE